MTAALAEHKVCIAIGIALFVIGILLPVLFVAGCGSASSGVTTGTTPSLFH
ncbi:MAG TPA: hypothetical protein VMT59_13855 [Gaiellaceae bacterium]|nr:hypothetical protein [Gaiellaceae bacterium]